MVVMKVLVMDQEKPTPVSHTEKGEPVFHSEEEKEEFVKTHYPEGAKLAPIDPRHPIGFRKLHPDVITPTRGSEHAACFDLHAFMDAPVTIPPFTSVLIPTGISMFLPAYTEMQVRPRSGLSNKHRIFIPNAPGTVDADYTGEIKVGLYNGDPDRPYTVNPGDRIAQFLVAPVLPIRLVEFEEDNRVTARGGGGFGSTGD